MLRLRVSLVGRREDGAGAFADNLDETVIDWLLIGYDDDTHYVDVELCLDLEKDRP